MKEINLMGAWMKTHPDEPYSESDREKALAVAPGMPGKHLGPNTRKS